MAEKFEYETILINGPNLGVYAGVPFESAKIFGTRKAIRVKATFDGKMYRMSLLPHGNGTHWLHLRKEIRDAIGKEEGDTVSIVIEKDENPPKIEIPEYLEWLLENEPEMLNAFKKLSYSAKKFWIGFIEEPKSGDAKVKRVNRLFEFLKENQKPTLNGKT
ncbi:MAG TPA: DUF1905 domain-containing protein [Tangfeifania sp.]|nr:DUF1905 domain-containing protein [Tangfeifania sp.]